MARRVKSITLNAEDASNLTHPSSSRLLVPYSRDLLASLAKLIVSRFTHTLPDLTRCVVLLPQPLDSPRLRRYLLDEANVLGHRALLGPPIMSLRQWLNELVPPQSPPLSPQAQELILIETLNRHRNLFKESDPWLLAANLLELFEQLTQYHITLPGELKDFVTQLSNAYQLGKLRPAALSMEANVVHTLWHAWHTQLLEENRLDVQSAYISQLDESLTKLDSKLHIFLAGNHSPSPSEQRWIDLLIERGQLTLIEYGKDYSNNEDDPYTLYLNDVFASMQRETHHTPFRERAQEFAARFEESPAANHLFAYAAPSAEAEARGVDIQVRRWLLQGNRRIAIVTDNRRLARRIRALLERADVNLYDAAGWALSTTSAAAAVERWLECLEEDFSYQPLTDLLKSPFIFPEQNRDELLHAVYRFEQDLVLHENIPRNLHRYRTHLGYRRSRWPQAMGTRILALLDDIEAAAKPLLSLLLGNRSLSPDRWLDALEESLQRLGLATSFARDDAGARILQEFQVMRHALTGRHLSMSWGEFRTWLGRTMERYNFQSSATSSAVQLLSLEQSGLAHYDAIIIAGASATDMPGSSETSPFFNEAVRRELGLPGFQERLAMRFQYFRRLLQAAPQVFITVQQEDKGEPILASPWLEALQSFHYFSYAIPLNDDGLGVMVDDPQTQVIRGDSSALPPPSSMPTPAIRPELLPEKFSANTYQQLINCPYQFYAMRCLQLSAPEEVREALEKSDYGQRVHLALHAFHSNVDGYPGPFQQAINAANREAAIHCLQDISQAVFAKDLEDNFMHRGWLQRWRQLIPQYIDWEIKRAENWRVIDTEISVEKRHEELLLNGRLDRLDHGEDGIGIVDYKTGSTPNKDAVISGEEVQLPFYALLADQATHQTEYLRLDTNRFGSQAVLHGDELSQLVKQNGDRLHTIIDEIINGAPLPAWGDEQTCRYCAMSGICRKYAWSEQANLADFAIS